MFSIRKKNNRPSRRGLMDHKPDNAFHPRVETLEGRALPSVTVLSFNRPLVVLIGEPSFNFAVTIRIEVALAGGGSAGALPARSAAPANAGVVAAPSVTGSQIIANQTAENPTGDGTSPSASQQPNALSAVSPGSAVPTAASAEAAFLSAFSNAPTVVPPRPVGVRPSLPEQTFLLNGFIGATDRAPVLNTVVLPTPINTLTPDLRDTKPQPAVQAISNRMEFIGSAVTVTDYYVPDENPGEPSTPRPLPVNPPSADLEDTAPLAAAAGLALVQTAQADDGSLPEATDLSAVWDQVGERPILTPELVTEVATLAACAGGFRMQRDVAAWRGERTSGTEIVVGKRRSRP